MPLQTVLNKHRGYFWNRSQIMDLLAWCWGMLASLASLAGRCELRNREVSPPECCNSD